jgi:N-acetylmuramoyl-L-alanine amidase
MILDFFHLREQPFGVTPDPAYLYHSRTHCEALDSLTEAILGDRGFMALIAEPGMGKTTLLHQVLEGLRDTARAVFLFQTQCNSREFFQYLMSELGVDSTGMGLVAMHNKLNEILFAEMLAGRRFVLIVDEAQNLDDSVLETIRLLSNFETPHSKLLQIILSGQPQLGEKLEQKQLDQLLQRITVMKYLEALSPEETAGYIRHRLKIAGHHGEPLFEPEALALIAEHSKCIPRNINKVCYRSLLEGYAEGCRTLSPAIVEKAIRRPELRTPNRPALIPVPGPSLALSSVHPQEPVALPPTPQLIYRPPSKTGLPSRGIWTAALIAALLSAGLALSRPVRKQISELIRNEMVASQGLVARESSRLVGRLSNAQQAAESDGTLESSLTGREVPSATAVRTANSDTDPQLVAHQAQPIAALKSGFNFELSSQNASKTLVGISASDGGPFSLTRELGLKINRIAIDPGHGGFDTGTAGPSGLLEKDLCLDVALRLGRLVEENIPSAQVVYTRKDDRHVSLEERTEIANAANADLFISIHANSSDAREIRGVETYYVSLADSRESRDLAARENALAESSFHNLPELVKKITRNEKLGESRQLARNVQNSLSRQLQMVSRRESNRGVKQAPFLVLTGANMPAVLSEISFVSNASDENLLLGSDQRQRIAEGLYRGIVAYLDNMPGPPPAQRKLVSEVHPVSPSGY